MLPGMRSNTGCAAWHARKRLFLQCFVGFGSAAVIPTSAQDIYRRPGAPCWKTRLSKSDLSSFVSGTASWAQLGLKLRTSNWRAKMPRTAGEMGFLHCRSWNCHPTYSSSFSNMLWGSKGLVSFCCCFGFFGLSGQTKKSPKHGK